MAAVARLRASAEHLASASEQLDGMLTEDRGALHGFAQESLPQIDALLRDSRDAAREVRAAVEEPARESGAGAVSAGQRRRGDSKMTLKTRGARALTAGALLMMAGCSGFHSNEAPTQVYTLDPVFAAVQGRDRRHGPEPAAAAATGRAGPRHRAHRAPAQRAAARLLRGQPLADAAPGIRCSRWPSRRCAPPESTGPCNPTAPRSPPMRCCRSRSAASRPNTRARVRRSCTCSCSPRSGSRTDRTVLASVSAESSVTGQPKIACRRWSRPSRRRRPRRSPSWSEQLPP